MSTCWICLLLSLPSATTLHPHSVPSAHSATFNFWLLSEAATSGTAHVWVFDCGGDLWHCMVMELLLCAPAVNRMGACPCVAGPITDILTHTDPGALRCLSLCCVCKVTHMHVPMRAKKIIPGLGVSG